MSNNISRSKLFELLWSLPMTKLEKQLLVKSSTLKEICIKYNIPLPKPGHWEKIKYGKAEGAPNLPEPQNDIIITLTATNQNRAELEAEISMSIGDHFMIPNRLVNPCLWIKKAKQYEETNKNDGFLDRGLKHIRDGVRISAQPSNIARCFRFLNKLIELVLLRGHSVLYKDALIFKINGIEFKIVLREKHKRVKVDNPKNSWEQIQFLPTNIIILVAEADYRHSFSWMDGKVKLEGQLSMIIAGFELASIEVIKYQNELERIWAKQREEKRKRDEETARIELEKNAYQKLLHDIDRWNQSESIRSYINSYEHNLIQLGSINTKQKNYIEWARKKAEWADPTICLTDPILGEY